MDATAFNTYTHENGIETRVSRDVTPTNVASMPLGRGTVSSMNSSVLIRTANPSAPDKDVATASQTFENKTDRVHTNEVDKMYTYLNRDNQLKVKTFIQNKPHLVSLLLNTPKHIKAYFGEENLSIELINDPCKFDQNKLAIFILTSLPAKDASDKMDALLLSDWADTYGEFMDDLLVTVRFK